MTPGAAGHQDPAPGTIVCLGGEDHADVRPGDHVGATFDTSDTFLRNTVAFAEEGLAAGAQVMIFPGDPYRDDPAGFHDLLRSRSAAIAAADGTGRVRVADSRRVQLAPGRFDPAHLRAAYESVTEAAVAAGHRGLWVSVDMAWARDAEPAALVAFEAAAFPLFTGGRLSAVCHYDTRVFPHPVVSAACRAHPAGLGRAEPLRHRREDDGRTLRLYGGGDTDNALAFEALVGSVGPGDTLDISAMTFIGVRAAGVVARRQARVPELTVETSQRQAGLLHLVRSAGRVALRPDRASRRGRT